MAKETTPKEEEEECPMCAGDGWWPHPMRVDGREYCKICDKGRVLAERAKARPPTETMH